MNKKYFYTLLILFVSSQSFESMIHPAKRDEYNIHSNTNSFSHAFKLQQQAEQIRNQIVLQRIINNYSHQNNTLKDIPVNTEQRHNFALVSNENAKDAIAIFTIPAQSKIYNLSQEEIEKVKELFKVLQIESCGNYKIIRFSYQDKSLLPETKEQALFLLYSPYIKNSQGPSYGPTEPSPLNDTQKKALYQNDFDFEKIPWPITQKPEPKSRQEGLLGSTRIKTRNGYCKIQDLKIGDNVACFDEKTQTKTFSQVTNIECTHLLKHIQITIGDQLIHVAPDHRFYIPILGTWVTAKDIQNYHSLRTLIYPNIQDVKEVDEALDVFRITVDSTHNFYITPNNILVHNANVLPSISLVLEYVSLSHPLFKVAKTCLSVYCFADKISNLVHNNSQKAALQVQQNIQSAELQERNYFKARKQDLINLRNQLLAVKSNLRSYSENFSILGKNLSDHFLNYTQIQQDFFLEPSSDTELKLNENQKKDLSFLRESQLEQYEKEIENLHLDIAFYINEFISNYAQNSHNLQLIQDKLNSGIDQWNNSSFVQSKENLKNYYESIIQVEHLIDEQKQKATELQTLFKYYKNAENAQILRDTTTINLTDLEKLLTQDLQINSLNKSNLSDFKNRLQISLAQFENIGCVNENARSRIINERNNQHSQNIKDAASKRGATQFPKPPEDDKDKEKNRLNGKYEDAPYHHINSRGNKNPAPKNGQKALDNSIQIKETSPRRIGISENEIVVLDKTLEGIYHGHVRSWSELLEPMKNALIKAGLVNQAGKILK